MIKIGILLIVFGVLSGCNFLVDNTSPTSPDVFPAPLRDVDHTASLTVVIDGIPFNLTKDIYINQSEKIFLDSKFPGIIRVKKAPLVWQDFFDSVPIDVSKNCLTLDIRSSYCRTESKELKMFLNRIRVDTLLDKPVTDGDQILLSYGDETGIEIERQFSLLPNLPD